VDVDYLPSPVFSADELIPRSYDFRERPARRLLLDEDE
jgi:hypothetical protein